jgi:Carboxypeptidase regulatory-like domain/TonB dependent receptor
MRRTVAIFVALFSLVVVAVAAAQSGTGSLRGTVRDEQGGVLPGVTVTARSPQALTPGVAVTDQAGEFRITNIAPGTYTLTAELTGFAVSHLEGILLRAGANFQVQDITLKLGSVEESITVSGESPMVEVSTSTTSMNIDAQFQKALPLTEGAFWTDFLQMTPGVLSRPHNDGSGRQNYYAQGVEHREHVTLMDGMMAANYWDMNVNRTGLSGEAIADTNVKLGGVDASAPMGYGLVINMAAKSGGNIFSGSAGYTGQPFSWNDSNAIEREGVTGTAGTRRVRQADVSFGGPVLRDRTWFFGAYRMALIDSTVDRSPQDIQAFQAFRPDVDPNDLLNELYSQQPFFKVTTKVRSNHELTGVVQYDRMRQKSVRSNDSERITRTDVGGGMYGLSLQSVWGTNVTMKVAANYNNKRGNDRDSYEQELIDLGPTYAIHRTADQNTVGFLTGSGSLLNGGGYGTIVLEKSSYSMIRGDLTWYKQAWGGSHEVQTGFLLMPTNQYEGVSTALNDGFISEERRLTDPNNLYSPVIPFARTYRTSALTHVNQSGRDHDYGVYVQDTWRPISRLTATIGVRADFVERFDRLRDFVVQNSVEIGPRFGGTFLITSDAKNVARASFSRVHRQLMGGRDAVASFGTPPGSSSLTIYDLNGDGIFDREDPVPAIPLRVETMRFDPDFHQPFIDEYVVGYMRQFPLDLSLDVSFTTKAYRDQYAQVDINGFWPEAAGLPFGGFGRVDPNSGLIYRLTNMSWSSAKYRGVMFTLAKNMSHNFQAMMSYQHQWQHQDGTWNPTDPARFIQPDAFPNDKTIWRQQDPVDHNSLATGASLRNTPTWTPGSFRLAGTWNAPRGVIVSGSYTAVGGPWTGPILTQLPANSPEVTRFGPSNVVNPETGARFANPLATRIRFLYPTRGEGQEGLPYVHTVNMKLGYRINLSDRQYVQFGANIYNVMNAGRYTEWHRSGANLSYNPTFYLVQDNQQTSRAYQVDITYRF